MRTLRQASQALAERMPTATKLGIGAAVSALNLLVYVVPNRWVLQPPRQLPWTALDAAVPLVPATVWIYLSDYFLVASAFLLCVTRADTLRFTRAYLALLVAGALAHIGWPTVFPREQFAAHGEGLSIAALAVLRELDQPTSCLPSMHVACSYLAALSLWRRPPALRVTWLVWATAVALSTLTTKQHYAVDVVAGAALAGAAWAVFFVWLPEWHAPRRDRYATATHSR